MNSLEALEYAKAIKNADWYYNYSDDYGAYSRGMASVNAVHKMIENREWNVEDVESVRHEIINILKIHNSGKEIEEKTYSYWNEKIDYLFRKVLEK